MNMLDKGTQLEANSIIRYPKQPVVRAVGISVAGVNGELAKPAVPAESLAAAHQAMPLVAAGEQTFSFQPTLENELAPVPGTVANMPAIQESPPAAVSNTVVGDSVGRKVAPIEEELPPAVPVMEKPVATQEEVNVAPKMQPKTEPVVENEVPKAIPVKRYSPPAIEKPAVKKVASVPAAKPARSSSYTVKPNDTLYNIANRHGVTVKALQLANKIAKPESLRDGMKLVIPAK
jgi:LysM repeat protein